MVPQAGTSSQPGLQAGRAGGNGLAKAVGATPPVHGAVAASADANGAPPPSEAAAAAAGTASAGAEPTPPPPGSSAWPSCPFSQQLHAVAGLCERLVGGVCAALSPGCREVAEVGGVVWRGVACP